jgi:hypothetical protein
VSLDIEVLQMTVDEFADYQIAIGSAVERYGALYWLRKKGLFFRPLLLHEAFSPSASDLPPLGLGGFQYIVPDWHEANSTMRFLILDDVHAYALGKLQSKRRLLIKNAAKLFVVRPIKEIAEFQEQGFHAYSSFYQRTRYQYKPERTRRSQFDQWADAVLKCTKALVLGGYDQGGKLKSVSISHWVGKSLLYSTFFSDTPTLQKGIGELMFHVLRETASRTPGIEDVMVRRYQGGNGMDNYYLLRGARLVCRPAKLRLHPAAKWILKSCFPARYATLGEGQELGLLSEEGHGTCGPLNA